MLHLIAPVIAATALALFRRVPAPVFADGMVTDCSNDGQFSGLLPLGGTVTFSCTAPATINFASGKNITTSVTIDGLNHGNPVVLSGRDARRLFWINSGFTLNLLNLTVTHGTITDNNGGNIFNQGTVNLTNVTIINGRASEGAGDVGGNGGGIYNAPALH